MTNTSSPFICTHYQYNTAKSTRRQILIQSRSREVQDTPPTVLPWGPIAHTLILLVLVSNGMGLQTAMPGTIQKTSALSTLWPYGYPLNNLETHHYYSNAKSNCSNHIQFWIEDIIDGIRTRLKRNSIHWCLIHTVCFCLLELKPADWCYTFD